MTSATVNVFRYTALLSGVVYGIVHKRTLQAEYDAKKSHHKEHRREQLIEEAKRAWAAKQASSKSDVITDPEDPKFDLEKLIAKWERETQ
ncbi:hypothetical protein EXIGLDRAFT_715333 [Exidia glandulosa HHB12029]|uniref:ATP synthase F(0) complex subunit e, mitochondrial n=1 Tax=Exidia glandulosa HHB12029 TaxID=1314781 RepID=A0A165JHQ2_EXIGL|nr:hypothetical protein EXIGLDRAFT_715333 [Exidia glandulosa HHB12029]